jgi:hypothetical protein
MLTGFNYFMTECKGWILWQRWWTLQGTDRPVGWIHDWRTLLSGTQLLIIMLFTDAVSAAEVMGYDYEWWIRKTWIEATIFQHFPQGPADIHEIYQRENTHSGQRIEPGTSRLQRTPFYRLPLCTSNNITNKRTKKSSKRQESSHKSVR